jgi:hypothetical protein
MGIVGGCRDEGVDFYNCYARYTKMSPFGLQNKIDLGIKLFICCGDGFLIEFDGF